MNYNPYAMPNYGVPQKSPQQLMEEYSNLMSQLQNMQNGTTKAPQNASVSDKGQFVKVSSFDEVKDYPTSLDGTATLFFDFTNKVFWSKKFLNGSHAIQAFKFEPINSGESASNNDEIDYTKELEVTPDPTTERLDKLEKMLESLIAKKSPTKPKKAEDIKNEI